MKRLVERIERLEEKLLPATSGCAMIRVTRENFIPALQQAREHMPAGAGTTINLLKAPTSHTTPTP